MKILAIETSAKPCSVAILEDDKILYEAFLNISLTHSETLLPMIETALNMCKLKTKDIDLFAVSHGPGSFTGIRIGVATIKGLALPTNTPCVSVDTLKSMAYNVPINSYVASLIDARRNTLFAGIYEKNSEVREVLAPCHIECSELCQNILEISKKNLVFLVGDGKDLCYNNINELTNTNNIILASQNIGYQRASSVGFLAKEMFENGDVQSYDTILPCYLKPSQAERELKEKEGK